MSNEELGKALAESRIARGLTLHDVERDTRISSRYLKALEEGQFDVLPAPVYARAFMRTYAQYLGLDASALVQHLPGARPESELPALPEVGRDATAPLISASRLVAGVVVVLLLAVGLVLFWNRGGDGETLTSGPPQVEEPSGGPQQEPPSDVSVPIVVEVGVVPAVERESLLAAVDALMAAELRYLVIEVETDAAAPGIVFQQSPTAGTLAVEETVVTLVASR